MITSGRERRLIAPAAAVLVCLITIPPAAGQQATAEKPQMVEDVFKNVQVLKGIPVNEFMDTMGFFAAALGLNCTGCHVPESLQDWSKFADDVPRKRMARANDPYGERVQQDGLRRTAHADVLDLPSRHAGHPRLFRAWCRNTPLPRKIRTPSRLFPTRRKGRPPISFWISSFRHPETRSIWRRLPVGPPRAPSKVLTLII